MTKQYPHKPIAHGFSDIVDNYAGDATKFKLPDGASLYQLEGAYNGAEGRFEWILDGDQISHRMFVSGGTINGRPIIP